MYQNSKNKKIVITKNTGPNVEKLDHSHIVGGKVNGITTLAKILSGSYSIKHALLM